MSLCIDAYPFMCRCRMAGSAVASSQRSFAACLIRVRGASPWSRYLRAAATISAISESSGKALNCWRDVILEHSRQATHLVRMRLEKNARSTAERGKNRRMISPGDEQPGMGQYGPAHEDGRIRRNYPHALLLGNLLQERIREIILCEVDVISKLT